MSIKKISKSPALNTVVMQLEMTIHRADSASVSDFGEHAQDGWARSVFLRDLARLTGKKPNPIKGDSPREEWIRNVSKAHLVILREEKDNIGIGGLKTCVKAIQESMLIHQDENKRGYLDYLTEFFGQQSFEDHR